jgi:hypothetical protein
MVFAAVFISAVKAGPRKVRCLVAAMGLPVTVPVSAPGGDFVVSI